jgi:hypothetical protein
VAGHQALYGFIGVEELIAAREERQPRRHRQDSDDKQRHVAAG